MNHKTLGKIEKVKAAISEGKTEFEIRTELFSRRENGTYGRKEFMEKYKDLIFDKVEEIQEVEPMELEEVKESTPSIISNEDMRTLRELLDNAPSILSLINPKELTEDITEYLTVNEELIKSQDLKLTTIRIDKTVSKEFDKLAGKYKIYSKTSLYNQALKEFVDRYKG